jgi:molecular chaperone DnaJ
MNRNDYYTLLGVPPTASKAAIRRAFQKLARKYHPDLNPGDNVAAVRYRRIYEAFEVLTDADRRERYDANGGSPVDESPEEPLRFGFEGFDFSLEGEKKTDIFPELFRRTPPRQSQVSERGEDIHHRLALSFEEALEGLRASFRISRALTCPTCQGFGEIPSGDRKPCSACGGEGRTIEVHGFMLFARPCAHCSGTGRLARDRCPDCGGAGQTQSLEIVEVEIPRGVADGDKVVVPMRGHEGRGSGATGDLYVHIQVKPHPLFTRKGDNLFCTVPITFVEAALGARIEVPTPEGPVKLRVPAGIRSGQKLRLSGRGAPSRRGDLRGDLFFVMKIVTPSVYDDRSRELLRELDRINPLTEREPYASLTSEVSE